MTFQTFTGKEYLKIDIANNFGLDKEDWDVRIKWFDDNEPDLDALIRKAKEPALYYAGVQAWKRTVSGKPSSYPISLDATSSGIQFLAVLTGDKKAAALCNVVDTGHREDAYTGLYNSMLMKTGGKAMVSRDDTKQAIMTAFYSSTAVPKQVFGEGELLNIFYETMKSEAPGAWELTETMLGIWDNTAYVNQWVMPDNFHVKIKVMGTSSEHIRFRDEPFEVAFSENKPIDNGRSLGANLVHSIDGMVVREITSRCHFNPDHVKSITRWLNEVRGGTSTSRDIDKIVMRIAELHKDSGFLSARVLQYVDAANMGHLDQNALRSLVQSLSAKPFQVLSIHDCFRVLPNYGNDLRLQYNTLLTELAKSDLLSFLLSQIIGRYITVDKLDPKMYEEIMDANYALS